MATRAETRRLTARELRAKLDAILAASPLVLPAEAAAELPAIPDPDALRGRPWFQEADRWAERAGRRVRPAAAIALKPSAGPSMEEADRFLTEDVAALRRTLPQVRVELFTAEETLKTFLTEGKGQGDEARARIRQHFTKEPPRLHWQFTENFHQGLTRGASPRLMVFEIEEGSAYGLQAASPHWARSVETPTHAKGRRNAEIDRLPLDARFLAFVNDHEFAHLVSRVTREGEEAAKPDRRAERVEAALPWHGPKHVSYLEENRADAYAILMAHKRFGDAEDFAERWTVFRDLKFLHDKDAEHWTTPVVNAASTFARSKEGRVWLATADALAVHGRARSLTDRNALGRGDFARLVDEMARFQTGAPTSEALSPAADAARRYLFKRYALLEAANREPLSDARAPQLEASVRGNPLQADLVRRAAAFADFEEEAKGLSARIDGQPLSTTFKDAALLLRRSMDVSKHEARFADEAGREHVRADLQRCAAVATAFDDAAGVDAPKLKSLEYLRAGVRQVVRTDVPMDGTSLRATKALLSRVEAAADRLIQEERKALGLDVEPPWDVSEPAPLGPLKAGPSRAGGRRRRAASLAR